MTQFMFQAGQLKFKPYLSDNLLQILKDIANELKNIINQEIDELIATKNQRIATATQSQQAKETEILQLLQEANEKKQKHIRGMETSNKIYQNVNEYFKLFYSGRTEGEFQAKLDSYKSKSEYEATREEIN